VQSLAGTSGERFKENESSHSFSSFRYNWVAVQLLSFCYAICCFAGAAQSDSKGYGFLAVWSMLMVLAYSAGGTLILRRLDYRTPLAVGFLIGVGAVMVNVMLLVAVVSGSNLAKFGSPISPPGEGAVQAFAVLLLLGYSTFTAFTVVYRDTLLPPPMVSQETEGLPPGQPSYGNSQYDAGTSGYGGEGQPSFSDAPAGSAAVL